MMNYFSLVFSSSGFLEQFIAALVIFILGCAATSFLRIFIFPSKSKSGRFVSACVFLTFAILLYTVLIFLTKSLFPFHDFLQSHFRSGCSLQSFVLILLIEFVSGILISACWKIFLPLFLFFYAGTSFYAYRFFEKDFGHQTKSLQLTFNKSSLLAGDRILEHDGYEGKILILPHCRLSDSLPFLLPRDWYDFNSLKIIALSDSIPVKKHIFFKQTENLTIEFPEKLYYPGIFLLKLNYADLASELKLEKIL